MNLTVQPATYRSVVGNAITDQRVESADFSGEFLPNKGLSNADGSQVLNKKTPTKHQASAVRYDLPNRQNDKATVCHLFA